MFRCRRFSSSVAWDLHLKKRMILKGRCKTTDLHGSITAIAEVQSGQNNILFRVAGTL